MSDDVLSDPFRKAIVGCKLFDALDFFRQFAWSAESFGSVDERTHPGDLMAPFSVTLVVNKLRSVCVLSVDRNTCGVYFKVQEMWYTILELVKCEFQVL